MVKKSEVLEFFGGVTKTAKAVRVEHTAVSQWPDELSRAVADRAVAAAYRVGMVPPDHWLRDGESQDAA